MEDYVMLKKCKNKTFKLEDMNDLIKLSKKNKEKINKPITKEEIKGWKELGEILDRKKDGA